MGKYRFSAEEQAFFEGLPQPFAVFQLVDKQVVALALSDGFCELFGYDDRAKAYRDVDNDRYADTHPDDVARIADAALRFATEDDSFEVIYRSKTRGTLDYRVIHAIGKHALTDTGVQVAHVWYTDEGQYVEEGKNQGTRLNHALSKALHEESLIRSSYYDYLTGLPNMANFFELADAGKAAIRQSGSEPVMLFMNLSGMKYFNTQYSFTEGDKLLREFAQVLKSTFGSGRCCHVGSDHFVAFAEEEGIEDMLQCFFEDCSTLHGGNSLPVRVGIYPNSLDNVDVSVACDRAKFACDLLPEAFESSFGYYDDTLRDSAERRRYVVSNLETAIAQHWIQVRYQPIVRAVNGRVCDEEALARWLDPHLGLLSPADFIPALEDAGIIYKLDLYVLEQVLKDIQRKRDLGFQVVPHSINLSRMDFFACDIVQEVAKRVDAAGIERSMITIEVTESTMGSDFDFMYKQVARFRDFGFPVWMDDFGSGYSSVDILQTVEFDLIKFDMSFMRRLDEGDSAKIVLTELMKMAIALDVDTVCEGVETEQQVLFLQEVGCSKLQGYYYCKPISVDTLIQRYEKGEQIGFENPAEASYFEAIGRVNLYDLAVMAHDEDDAFQNYFNTLPMGIVEIGDEAAEFVRTNQSYRDFMKRFFGFDLVKNSAGYPAVPFGAGSSFMQLVRQCRDKGNRAFFDEVMPDGSIVHSFIRRVGTNPITGMNAAAIAVLSITEPDDGATYASIARALAADYYNIYTVDLNTEHFVEYSSPVGGQELSMQRHGESFFEASKRDTMARIYEDDRAPFLENFTKEKILEALEAQNVYTATYRLIDSGEPQYVYMKITWMNQRRNQVIVGVSVIDAQMKQQERLQKVMRERDVLSHVVAMSGNYLTLYTIDPDSGQYTEYNATSEYETLGLADQGDDFFRQAAIDGRKAIFEDDLPMYLEQFTEENVMRAIREQGVFNIQYRLMIGGKPKRVSLRIAEVHEANGTRLIAGVRAWETRKSDLIGSNPCAVV